MGKPGPLEKRFWAKVRKTAGCWQWLGGKRGAGYGTIRLGGTAEKIGAHRVSWMLHFGTIPEGMHVLHKCDVAECTNPQHLFLGTHADNMRDKEVKNRAGRDAKWLNNVKMNAVKRRKLTPTQEQEMRNLHAIGVSKRALARIFSIDRTCLRRILSPV